MATKPDTSKTGILASPLPLEHRVLTEAKIKDILKVSQKAKDVQILDYQWKEGSSKGDNYSSEVVACDIQAVIDGDKREYHWFAKVPIDDSDGNKFNRMMKMEEKEIMFYRDMLPAWNRLAKERGASFMINCLESPYTELHEDVEKGSILMMQNLRHLGYEDAMDKKKGLSVAHTKLVLGELAKFHALAYAHLNNYPGGITEGLDANEVIATSYLFEERPDDDKTIQDVRKMLGEQFQLNMIKTMDRIQEPGQDLVGAIKRFDKEHGILKHRDMLMVRDTSAFNTLCHGDAWFNNMLFKYVDGPDGQRVPVQVSLVDLAIVRYCSPCIDLTYFLYSSTTPLLRATHLDFLLEHYHNTLVRCLHELKEDPTVYPYRQFLKEFNKYSFWGFCMSFVLLPTVLASKEDVVGRDDMKGGFGDKKAMEAFFSTAEKSIKNEPQIKIVLGGNTLDMIQRGIIKGP